MDDRKIARELDRRAALCRFNGGHKWGSGVCDQIKRFMRRECLRCGSRERSFYIETKGHRIVGEWRAIRRKDLKSTLVWVEGFEKFQEKSKLVQVS